MSFLQQFIIISGALLGFFGIAAGAFGAHFLKNRLSLEMLQVFEVAARYQLFNAVTLIALGGLVGVFHSCWFSFAAGFLISGTVIFSGSLYLLIFSEIRFWGALTPIGGVFLLLGWLSILMSALFGRAIS